jgi:hypothetical protein
MERRSSYGEALRGKLGLEVLGDVKPVGEENADEKLEIIPLSDVLMCGIVLDNGKLEEACFPPPHKEFPRCSLMKFGFVFATWLLYSRQLAFAEPPTRGMRHN